MNIYRLLKFLCRLPMLYLGFWVFCSFMILLIEVEFYSNSIEGLFLNSAPFLLLASVIFIFLHFQNKIPTKLLPMALFGTICTSLITIYFQACISFCFIFLPQDIRVIYTHKSRFGQKIVLRTIPFGRDFEEGNSITCKTIFIPPIFKISEPIDTLKINTEKWRKVTDN